MKGLIDKTKAILGLLKVEPIKTIEELLKTCQGYAATEIGRDAKKVQLDAELQMVKDQHEGAIETLNATLAHEFKRIRAWADGNRATAFGKKQTFVLQGHMLEYHKSPGAIVFKEGYDAEGVVEAILAMPTETDEDHSEEAKLGDELRTLLRVKAELEKKAAMRLMRLKGAAAARLEAMGVEVRFEESFAFTASREALSPGTAVARDDGATPAQRAAA